MPYSRVELRIHAFQSTSTSKMAGSYKSIVSAIIILLKVTDFNASKLGIA